MGMGGMGMGAHSMAMNLGNMSPQMGEMGGMVRLLLSNRCIGDTHLSANVRMPCLAHVRSRLELQLKILPQGGMAGYGHMGGMGGNMVRQRAASSHLQLSS